jgi:hypothetical protein
MSWWVAWRRNSSSDRNRHDVVEYGSKTEFQQQEKGGGESTLDDCAAITKSPLSNGAAISDTSMTEKHERCNTVISKDTRSFSVGTDTRYSLEGNEQLINRLQINIQDREVGSNGEAPQVRPDSPENETNHHAQKPKYSTHSKSRIRQENAQESELEQQHQRSFRQNESRLSKLRERTRAIRATVGEKRSELTESRQTMSAADEGFMKAVRKIRLRPFDKENQDILEEEFKKLQAARDLYGPLEDSYNTADLRRSAVL